MFVLLQMNVVTVPPVRLPEILNRFCVRKKSVAIVSVTVISNENDVCVKTVKALGDGVKVLSDALAFASPHKRGSPSASQHGKHIQ